MQFASTEAMMHADMIYYTYAHTNMYTHTHTPPVVACAWGAQDAGLSAPN